MIPRLIPVLALVSLATPAAAQGQDAPDHAVVQSYWKCDWGALGEISEFADSVYVPISQGLVNEGKLIYFQLLVHDWADEWNVVLYWRTEDKAAFFTAWDEWVARLRERAPGSFGWFTERCSEHRDGIYRSVAYTQPPSR